MDCLEGMRMLPDKCVDLVVTDPPYEFCRGGSGGAFGKEKRSYHDELNEICSGISNEFLEQMLRVCKKPNMYLFCSKDQLPQYLNFAVANDLNFDVLTWHKTNPTPTCNNKYLSDTEYIVFMRKNVAVYGTYETKKKYWVQECNTEDKDMWHHPTIKPLNIIETLLINSSQEGDVVLDPFMGSGTTAVAAIKQKRNYIGYELNPDYFHICEKRVAAQKATLTLF